jgi:hypothetical protein
MGEEDYVTKLKQELNNAIWMTAPAETTLAQAEEATFAALTVICGYENKRNEKAVASVS